MKKVKGLSYIQLQNYLLNKKVRFKSDCEFFPNFNVIGKVTKITNIGTEIIIEVLTLDHKYIKVGSNMKNLTYEIL